VSPTIYREQDADPEVLTGSTTAVVGYGNLGRSIALNLRDSGLQVVVGNHDDDYRALAESEGFRVLDIGAAVAAADLVLVMLPDEVMPGCFETEIAPSLRTGAAVCFASGYVLAFGLVTPPSGIDVLLVAPRMLGEEARRCYESGTGFWSYVSVERDETGRARDRLLAIAAAAGALRRGALELSAKQEALLDLFVEQAPGAVFGVAIQLAFQLGVEAGLPAEAMVLELYMSGEMARTFQTFADGGFFPSVGAHGLTATFGGFLSTLALDREAMEGHFRETLEQIRDGRFAKRLQQEQEADYPTVGAIQSLLTGDDPMTAAERSVRKAVD
jgi:ketol-acid reductoisomerase